MNVIQHNNKRKTGKTPRKIRLVLTILFWGLLPFGTSAQSYYNNNGEIVLKINASEGQINKATTKIVRTAGDARSKTWLARKSAGPRSAADSVGKPDVIFKVKLPHAGLYYLRTYAIETGQPTGKTSHIGIQIDHQRVTRRIVFDSYHGAAQVAGKFHFTGQHQELKLWLPSGIQLAVVEFKEFIPPAVPEAVRNYTPGITPPASRPRLWVNHESLPVVRGRLTLGENKPEWEKVKAAALAPFRFDFQPDHEIFHREDVEKAAETKAFYYLMTGDKKVGSEAVTLMRNYLSVLEFGNITYGDITREVGRAIYTAALVYDWCYDLLDATSKKELFDQMHKLAIEMEIGWPPFDESLLNGHGNEAQLSRDLLAMSIAVYDEDPEPYRYTSYRILEQLVPMRKFEYQSPRHNQGVDYGAYRFGWEMHGVWLLYRMSGRTSFDDNIKNLPDYWLYMRLPDGYMLRDGDMFSIKNKGTQPGYWKHPQTMLLSYAYSNNPLIKGEFERQGGLPDNPVLYLLVNDPALKADHDLTKLPQTKDFGKVLGSMVARTGWDNTPSSNDVIAEIKGGGYNFGNHQHADAGAMQIFYKGIQMGDIGLYLSYGPPYDMEFNKRSISHSTMLVLDPDEQLLFRTKKHDGGSRFSQRFPLSPRETMSDPWYNYGSVVSSHFGPDAVKPAYSYFKADLTAAYTGKVSHFTREFCFLDLNRKDVPAVIILSDDIASSNADFTKYWQINTINTPDTTGSAIGLHNQLNGVTGKTHVRMLVPAPADRTLEIKSGKEANSTFGQQFDVKSDKPEASGHRIMVSPKGKNKQDRFLTVFQILSDNTQPLPVQFSESDGRYLLTFADRVVSMNASSDFAASAFKVSAPNDTTYQLILTGLQPGFWSVKAKNGAAPTNYDVKPGENTLYFTSAGGHFEVTPGRTRETQDVQPPARP
ncbi:hypothetical protein [Dyadobacter jiangsuensis]|uniref:Heparin/heparan-sulfate lyase n=1 Tax=Dyadobacter jiangsuensis TaxID=1591085 RepID=A0A2P8GI61_9BACT|nr:hypothetical protein [Dyadobacter jiangsuensis]PSL33664.1 heparin/heparan-sulfate lyase [Dyadobacter jiangsuensis]